MHSNTATKMYSLPRSSASPMAWTTIVLFMINLVSAYRPVQHCKHIFDNGHYSACAALTQYYNATTGAPDLYLRYHWYRYQGTNKGWHAFALGPQMAGAHMLIMYGDTTGPSGSLTASVRTADGHHPVRPIAEFPQFDKYFVPSVDIVTAKFEEYTGPFYHKVLKQKPTHVGVTEAIFRSWNLWPGATVLNTSTHQEMLWSSNFKQDFQSDFSSDRNVDMHLYGAGFGFLWVDMLNAETPEPMFGHIDELAGLKGVSEISEPAAPTEEELADGQVYIESMLAAQATTSSTPTLHTIIRPSATSTADPSATSAESESESESQDDAIPDQTGTGDNTNEPPTTPPIQQPARTILGKTLRDWMWHLHGVLMILSFLVLYPLGTYLLRRPPPSANGNGFNSHWTIQCLASVSLVIGAAIGYINSYGISVTHQYLGIFLVLVIGVQMFLGWRHHVIYLATQRKTVFSKLHIYTGRTILPLGYVNIVLGMLLRHYGWFTMTLLVISMLLEAAFLIFVLRGAGRNARVDSGANSRTEAASMREEEAEEYFQLTGGDDEFSESDSEENGFAQGKQQEKRQQAERLAKLDKV